jgi:hypothetical protein
MPNKYHSEENPVSCFNYAPVIGDTGDLEAATKVISATSEAAGLGNATYSKALGAMAKPSDTRFVIDSMMTRLSIITDAFTCAHLRCRVYVDAQAANNMLYDLDIVAGPATTVAVSPCTTAVLPTVFALLTDGAAHTYYFFFWVDAGAATLSAVQLWKHYGCIGTNGGGTQFAHINHSGLLSIACYHMKLGAGTNCYFIFAPCLGFANTFANNFAVSNYASGSYLANPVVDDPILRYVNFTVQTDMMYLQSLCILFKN